MKRRIVVVGPSGSGKSTLVNHLRSPEFDEHIVIPRRVITLPVRADSDPVENHNVSIEEFQEGVRKKAIKPWWSRQFGDDPEDVHYYGFTKVSKSDPRVRLFLGNNALLGSNAKQVRKLMNSSLIVAVTADPDVRGDRLGERLPDMDAAEKAARVQDSLAQLERFNPLGVVTLDTTGQPYHASREQFTDIVLSYAAAPDITVDQRLVLPPTHQAAYAQ